LLKQRAEINAQIPNQSQSKNEPAPLVASIRQTVDQITQLSAKQLEMIENAKSHSYSTVEEQLLKVHRNLMSLDQVKYEFEQAIEAYFEGYNSVDSQINQIFNQLQSREQEIVALSSQVSNEPIFK